MTGSRSHRRFLILSLFFLSGISGLIYQIVWTRLLVLVFGNTLLATSTVLSAFMAGLAGGSYLIGKHVDRRPRSLIRLYAILEAGIGLFGLAFPLLLDAATPLYLTLYQILGGNVALLNLARFGICFALIFIPTFLMGGTLPVLLKRFVGGSATIGREVGNLYALNTAGAVVGALACGYFLLRVLGMRHTTWVAVAINLAVAVAAWLIARFESGPVNSAVPTPQSTTTGEGPTHSSATVLWVMIGIGISGFCALAYEVFWARMLNLFVRNNVHSFTAILATFLTGIALGSFIYSHFLSRVRRQAVLFAVIQVGIGGLSFATPFVFSLLHETLFLKHSEMLTLAKTAVIMLGPTILMGVAVPLAVQICQRGPRKEGTSVGTVYAVNTVGAILGAFVAGFLLIPFAGLNQGLIVVAGLNVLAGLLVWLTVAPHRWKAVWVTAFAALIAVAFVSTPRTLFRGLYERSQPTAEILHYKEGKVANVVVYNFVKSGYKDLFLNAVEEASSRLWHVQLFKMLGILPVMVHDEPGEALMIAFGAGMSAGACVDQVSRLDCVDLNPDIEGVARVFTEENRDVINHPNLNVIVNDGRNALLLDPKKYSLIISDATNPKNFDSWTLYTKEFYELVRARLEADGIFCQWVLIPLPGDAIKVLLNTFRSVFPHSSFWCIYGSTQCMMLATPERLEIDYQELSQRLEPVLETSGLSEFGVETVEKFLSFHLLGEDGLGKALQGFDKLNTDDLPHAQFGVRQDVEGVRSSLDLVRHQESIRTHLVNLGAERSRIERSLDTYHSISQRLHWGFLLGNPSEYKAAGVIAESFGLSDDQNIASALKFDRKRKEALVARLAEQPDDANAHNSMGYIFWQEGSLQDAIDSLRRAVELEPEFARAHASLARVLIDAERYDEATAKLLELKEISPAQSTLAEVARQLRVIHILRKLRYQPGSVELHEALGQIHAEAGDYIEVAQVLATAASLSSEDPDLYLRLAGLYERLEFVDDALGAYRRLAELQPGNQEVRGKVAALSRLQRDTVARQEWMSSHRRVKENTQRSDGHPATCALARKAWEESPFEGSIDPANLRQAASLFEESINEKPGDMHAYVDAARIHEALGEHEKAASIWRRGLAVSPGDRAAGDHIRRLELLAALDEPSPDGRAGATTLLEIGALYRLDRQLEQALDFSRRATEADPENREAWLQLGMIAKETGRVPLAGAALEQALTLAPPGSARERAIRKELSGLPTLTNDRED